MADNEARSGEARSTASESGQLQTVQRSSRGYVRQETESGLYRIGLRSFELGTAFAALDQITELTRPIMRELNGSSTNPRGQGAAHGLQPRRPEPVHQIGRHTPTTITNGEALQVELQRAMSVSDILDREEFHHGVQCGAVARSLGG